MRHRVAYRKLGRVTPHRKALLRNLATALFERERIRTTLPKAKEVRSFAEKLITLARREEDRLHARRLVARDIQNPAIVKKLFDTLGARFATRPGGYTRILRLGTRHGDGAEMAYLELVGYEYKPAKDEKGAKTTEAKKEAAKPEAGKPVKPAAKKAKPAANKAANKKASRKGAEAAE
jgi:large subunit ribosomal protein L17